MSIRSILSFLLSNVRFYILATTVCLSIFVISWLRLHIPSDQLFLIRTEQIFGYLCIVYWYIALVISPLQKRFGKRFGLECLAFSRRAIGVSAFYFALLHILISLYGQIGGISGLALLPGRFIWSIGFGVVAFVILLAMAATSFNKVITYMTFPRWKWLHRLGYIGGILAMLHLWMIGTHVAYQSFRVVIFVLLVTLFRLEALRIAEALARKFRFSAHKKAAIAALLWLAATVILLFIPQFVGSNNDHHTAAIWGVFS